MRHDRGEQLSALIDGELSDHEMDQVLDALERDEEMRGQWSRYHLISDSIRSTAANVSVTDLAERIRSAIADEPAILAPPRKSSRFIKPLAGFAIAASVAIVAVIGIQQPGQSGVLPLPVAVVQLSASGQPRAPAATVIQRVRWNVAQPVVETRLNSYLINHNERLSTGMYGILPYVRIVGYDARK